MDHDVPKHRSEVSVLFFPSNGSDGKVEGIKVTLDLPCGALITPMVHHGAFRRRGNLLSFKIYVFSHPSKVEKCHFYLIKYSIYQVKGSQVCFYLEVVKYVWSSTVHKHLHPTQLHPFNSSPSATCLIPSLPAAALVTTLQLHTHACEMCVRVCGDEGMCCGSAEVRQIDPVLICHWVLGDL